MREKRVVLCGWIIFLTHVARFNLPRVLCQQHRYQYPFWVCHQSKRLRCYRFYRSSHCSVVVFDSNSNAYSVFQVAGNFARPSSWLGICSCIIARNRIHSLALNRSRNTGNRYIWPFIVMFLNCSLWLLYGWAQHTLLKTLHLKLHNNKKANL